MYDGKWTDQIMAEIENKTGLNRKQINKWCWDQNESKHYEDKFTKPNVIFRVTDTKYDRDLTPSYQ